MAHPLQPRLRIYRLKNAQRYVYAAARDEQDALKMADRRYDDLEPWSAQWCGAQHDGKARSRGLLEHEQVMKLFAMAPVRE